MNSGVRQPKNMAIKYQNFTNSFINNSDHLIEFYLPDGTQIPKNFHITDVGSVFRHFIDCGGKIRNESYIQIQLWLGKDIEHRLNGQTVSTILKHSSVVLGKLSDLQNAEVIMEYKEKLTSQYPIKKIEVSNKSIKCYLEEIQTQCLAALRHEDEKRNIEVSDNCCNSKCGCG